MTAAEVATAGVARARVDRIKTGVEVIWSLIVESYEARDWESLGYASWDDLCTREFGTSRLRLPREERAETVQSLRDAGLSLRAISAATGISRPTIIKDLRPPQVVNSLPPAPVVVDRATGVVVEELAESDAELDARLGPIGYGDADSLEREVQEAFHAEIEPHPTITGLDGKTYTPAPKSPGRRPQRAPLLDTAKTRGFALRSSVDSLLRVFEDDRYRTNEKQVADALRGHLLYVAETVAAVLDQLP